MIGGCLPSNRIQTHFPNTSANSQKRGAFACNRRNTLSVGKPRLYCLAAKSIFNNSVLPSTCCAVRFKSPESESLTNFEFFFVFIIFFYLLCVLGLSPFTKKPAKTGRRVGVGFRGHHAVVAPC